MRDKLYSTQVVYVVEMEYYCINIKIKETVV